MPYHPAQNFQSLWEIQNQLEDLANTIELMALVLYAVTGDGSNSAVDVNIINNPVPVNQV